MGTDGRRHRARHIVRCVVSHAVDRPSDGQGGRRCPHDVSMVRGRRSDGGRQRAVHEARHRPKANGQGAQAKETGRAARAERHRGAGGQVSGHSRWQAAS